ncbi:MAG: hypothetical protein PHP02_09180 [Eubacteriales bacterium]|nr:hypothetical protein [Eubacteriales bacterium]
MKHMHLEWRGWLGHWISTLKQDVYQPYQDFSFEGMRTMEHLSQRDAQKGAYAPMPRGTRWGKTYEYCWLRDTVVIAKALAGQRIVMDLPAGGEAAVFLNGKPFGTYRSNWVEVPLHYLEDNFLTNSARAGDVDNGRGDVQLGRKELYAQDGLGVVVGDDGAIGGKND